MKTLLAPIGIAVAVVGITTLSGSPSPQQPDKPVRLHTLHTDGGDFKPKDLGDLWTMSSLVVEGVLTDVRSANTVSIDPASKESGTLPKTAYRISVNTVFKFDSAIRTELSHVDIVDVGGSVDRGEYIESYVNTTFPKLNKGESYLLFLVPSEADPGAYRLATAGAESVYLLVDDRIEPRGTGSVGREFAKLGRAATESQLRKRGGGM